MKESRGDLHGEPKNQAWMSHGMADPHDPRQLRGRNYHTFPSVYHQTNTPGFPGWFVWPFSLLALLNVVFAIALFNWKKWGFIGFCVTSILALAMNLYAGVGYRQSEIGLLGVATLYAVLQIGEERKGWSQLE